MHQEGNYQNLLKRGVVFKSFSYNNSVISIFILKTIYFILQNMFRSLHTFTINKLCQTFSYKDSYPSVLSSKVVYKFVCASCNSSYVGQTHRYLTTRIDEHFGKDKKSHIYQHLMSSVDCLNACSRHCFSILDTARTKHQLHIKESLFISWLKPTLNKQKSHQYIISLFI